MTARDEYEPSPAQWVRDQVELYESSGGKEGNVLRGVPVVVLTMTGAKSGKTRKVPLMRVEHGGNYAAVASMGGAPKNPVWYNNLVADPVIEVRDGESTYTMRAREVSGDEKADWWKRAVAVWPDYDSYQAKTERSIPLFVLEPND